jgi:hypothetical protein
MDLKFAFTTTSKLCVNSSSGLVDPSRLDARAP